MATLQVTKDSFSFVDGEDVAIILSTMSIPNASDRVEGLSKKELSPLPFGISVI
jgi:hypothetical protein